MSEKEESENIKKNWGGGKFITSFYAYVVQKEMWELNELNQNGADKSLIISKIININRTLLGFISGLKIA